MSLDKTITDLIKSLNEISRAGFALAAAVDRLADGNNAEVQEVTPTAAPDPVIAPAEPATVEAPVIDDEPFEAPTVPATAVTFKDARRAVIETTQEKGRDTMAAILAEMGAANIKELRQDQYAELIERCKAA